MSAAAVWRRLVAFACDDLRARAERVRLLAAEEAELYERVELVLRELHPDWAGEQGLVEDLRRERARTAELEARLARLETERQDVFAHERETTDRAREIVEALGAIVASRSHLHVPDRRKEDR